MGDNNPLAFPFGIAPGFDASHVAAGTIPIFSAVAAGANFLNLLTGSAGAPTTQSAKMYGSIGAACGDGSGLNAFTKFATGIASTISTCTVGLIFQQASFQNLGSLIGATNGAGSAGFYMRQSNVGGITNGQFGTGFTGSGTVTAAINTPYFYAYSGNAATTVGSQVLVNLATGAIQTASTAVGTPTAFAPTNCYIGATPLRAFDAEHFSAAGMMSNANLSLPQLLAWAADPWSFWYPQQDAAQVGSSAAAASQTFNNNWLNTVLTAWTPDSPQPQTSRSFFTAGSVAPTVNTPSINRNWLNTVLTAWTSDSPQPQQPGRFFTVGSAAPAVNNPSGVGVPKFVIVDDPPLPQQISKIAALLPVVAPVVNNPPFGKRNFFTWSWGEAQVTSLTGGDFIQSVDNPPIQTPGGDWLSAVLTAWLPAPPQPQQSGRFFTIGGVAPPAPGDQPPGVGVPKFVIVDDQPPFLQSNKVAAITFVPPVVNNPPFSYVGRNAYLINVLQSWQPPDPPPVQKGPLPPSITAVPVNNPPFSGFSRQFWNILATWEIPLPPQPQQTKYIITIIPPPIPSKELHDHPFFATFGKMTVH